MGQGNGSFRGLVARFVSFLVRVLLLPLMLEDPKRDVLLIGILVCAFYSGLGVGVSFLLYSNNFLQEMEIGSF